MQRAASVPVLAQCRTEKQRWGEADEHELVGWWTNGSQQVEYSRINEAMKGQMLMFIELLSQEIPLFHPKLRLLGTSPLKLCFHRFCAGGRCLSPPWGIPGIKKQRWQGYSNFKNLVYRLPAFANF